MTPKLSRFAALPIFAGALSVFLGAGCGEEAPPPSYPVIFVANSDPGVPLAGVQVLANGGAIGATAADGTLSVELSGVEGSSVAVAATCPEGYRPSEAISPLILRRVIDLATGGTASLHVTLNCRPANRHGVIIVRAGGEGPREGIPVLIDGREVARTDRSGVAHVALDMSPGSAFQVQLATATVAPMLRPTDPTMPFTFPDRDEVFVFDRPFDTEVPPAPVRTGRRRRRAAAPTTGAVHIPTRLGGR
jgi:hypothetical protein